MSAWKFGLYLNSLGNYFHNEIRDLVYCALSEKYLTINCDENTGFRTDLDWHIIVAPHEFFVLGNGVKLANDKLPEHLILITTEQVESPWFKIAGQYFNRAKVIWDIDFLTAGKLRADGLNCDHLGLGYHPELKLFQKINRLPEQTDYYLDKMIRNSPSGLHRPLIERPIDVFFIGAWTRRRSEIFARLGDALADWNSVILLVDTSKPVRSGCKGTLSTEFICGLEQRSKIVLNIHRDSQIYFESHRILLHGIGQGALVVSETCTTDSFFGEDDIIFCSVDRMPSLLKDLLHERSMESADKLIKSSYDKFLSKRKFTDEINKLIEKLSVTDHV